MNDERRKRGNDHDQKERGGQNQCLDEIGKLVVWTMVASVGHSESSWAGPSLCSLASNPIFK